MRVSDVALVAPSLEPVTVNECMADSRIDDVAFLDIIPTLIQSAREVAEQTTNRKLITQTWRVESDSWPSESDSFLLSPFQSASVTYWDGTTWATLASNQYVVVPVLGSVSRRGIAPAYGVTWPTLGDLAGPRVRIDVVCGYGATAASVPASIRMWIRQHVAATLRSPDAIGDQRKMVKMHWLDGLLRTHLVM